MSIFYLKNTFKPREPVFRFISSMVTAPLQKIFTEDMAQGGAEACSAATAEVVG
jgi:hypothetical protein